MRLYILVEGRTEERFVKDVLEPHLADQSVWAIPIIVTTRRDRQTGQKTRGGGHWKHWYRDLRRLIADNPGDGVRFTTLFDLYGLPRDFPKLATFASESDTVRRAQLLEQAMADAAVDHRLIPYLQRHEFEALVLACLDHLLALVDPSEHAGVHRLRESLRSLKPEDVNDGEATAPSKRLEQSIPSYDKVTHGPIAIGSAGLATVRAECPRFDSWLRTLESLSTQGPRGR
jgi:hypothetical protein